MSMKQLFDYIVEAILHALCWDVIPYEDFDWVKYLWGLIFVFLLGTFVVTIYYKAVACVKKYLSEIKKRKN